MSQQTETRTYVPTEIARTTFGEVPETVTSEGIDELQHLLNHAFDNERPMSLKLRERSNRTGWEILDSHGRVLYTEA